MEHDQQLREHVVYLLHGGGAHLDVERAIDGLSPAFRGTKSARMMTTMPDDVTARIEVRQRQDQKETANGS